MATTPILIVASSTFGENDEHAVRFIQRGFPGESPIIVFKKTTTNVTCPIGDGVTRQATERMRQLKRMESADVYIVFEFGISIRVDMDAMIQAVCLVERNGKSGRGVFKYGAVESQYLSAPDIYVRDAPEFNPNCYWIVLTNALNPTKLYLGESAQDMRLEKLTRDLILTGEKREKIIGELVSMIREYAPEKSEEEISGNIEEIFDKITV